MTNEEKYKTPDEREEAFTEFCSRRKQYCSECPCHGSFVARCSFFWLSLEVEKEEPCPFCGGGVRTVESSNGKKRFFCSCGYMSKGELEWDAAIAAHNRVCRAVIEYGEGGAK